MRNASLIAHGVSPHCFETVRVPIGNLDCHLQSLESSLRGLLIGKLGEYGLDAEKLTDFSVERLEQKLKYVSNFHAVYGFLLQQGVIVCTP